MVHSVIVNHEHLANSKSVRKAFTRAIVGQPSYVHACSRGVQVIEVKPLDP